MSTTDNIIPVPTLSTLGWTSTVAEKIDFLLTDFFYADKLQTSLYGSSVSSFSWIAEQYTNDAQGMASTVRDTLNTYLSRYYPQGVDVQTSAQLEDPSVSASRVILSVSVNFTENGKTYSMVKELTSINGQFEKFVNLNNTLQEATS